MKKLAPSTTYDQHCTYGGVDFLRRSLLSKKFTYLITFTVVLEAS